MISKSKAINKKRKKDRWTIGDYVIAAVLFVLALTMFYPIYNCVLVSIVPQYISIKTPFMLYPKKFDFTSYIYVFKETYVVNGILISTFKVFADGALQMFLNLTVAFSLTRPFPGRRFFYVFFFIPMYFGGGIIPTYILIKDLGLIDNIWALVLPSSVTIGTILIYMRYINGLPDELEDSGRMDGANEMIIFGRILLPLMKPMIATYFLYGAVNAWNSWFDGMLYMQSLKKMPVQTILREILLEVSSNKNMLMDTGERVIVYSEGVRMAALVIGMLPIMVLFPFLQKHFAGGLTVGAVKG